MVAVAVVVTVVVTETLPHAAANAVYLPNVAPVAAATTHVVEGRF
jgi:hypothetical protein